MADTFLADLSKARPQDRKRLRSEYVIAELGKSLPPTLVRGDVTIVFDAPPGLIRNSQGNIIGVDAMIRAFRNGVELVIDPHRIFINPPVQVPSGVKSVFRGSQVDVMKLDAVAAFTNILFQSIEETPAPGGFRTKGTVTTVFSDTVDGRVNSNSTTYSLARSGTALSADDTETFSAVGQDYNTFVALNYFCFETFFSFDTSSIGDTDQITSAVFSLALAADSSTTDFTINAHLKDWGAGVTTADWVAGASIAAQTLLATRATSGLAGGYNAFTENGSNFTANVNKTGSTRFMCSSSRHSGNNTPTGAEFVYFYMANEAGTTSDPKLVVTHFSLLSVSISGTTATTTLAGQIAAITAQRRVSVTGTQATTDLALPVHVVTAQRIVAIAGQLALLTLDALASVVSVQFVVSVSGAAATLALEAQPVTVTTVRIASVTGEAATLTLVGQAGAVSALISVSVSGQVAVLTLDANGAVISALQIVSASISGATATLSLSALEAVVSIVKLVFDLLHATDIRLPDLYTNLALPNLMQAASIQYVVTPATLPSLVTNTSLPSATDDLVL